MRVLHYLGTCLIHFLTILFLHTFYLHIIFWVAFAYNKNLVLIRVTLANLNIIVIFLCGLIPIISLITLFLILNADSEDTKCSFGMNDTLLESNGNDTLLEQHSLREILLAIECFQSRIINLRSSLREAYNKTDHTQKSRKKKDLHGLHKIKNVGRPFGEDGDEITAEMLFGVNNPLINLHIERICKEVSSYFVLPPFQIVSRFAFSRCVAFTMYPNICLCLDT